MSFRYYCGFQTFTLATVSVGKSVETSEQWRAEKQLIQNALNCTARHSLVRHGLKLISPETLKPSIHFILEIYSVILF